MCIRDRPISDRIGRIKPLVIGTLLFVIGSIGCALSTSMTMVVFWRVFQALGACTGPMISRAMIRDRYDSQRGAQMLSTLMMIMAVAPILGPLPVSYTHLDVYKRQLHHHATLHSSRSA